MKVKATLDEIAGNIRKFGEVDLDPRSTREFIRRIRKARRVFVYGAGRSGMVGKALAQRLMHLGFESYALGETITPFMNRRDLLICVSGSGGTTSTVAIARKAKKEGATVIAVTATPKSDMGRLADMVFYVRGKSKIAKTPSLAPFTSLFDITTLAVFDAICAQIMDELSITEKTIERTHANVE